MDIEQLRKHFRPTEREDCVSCQACIYDYLKYEYEIVINLISELEKKKLQYQKFFVTLVALIGTASITLLNYKSKIIINAASQAQNGGSGVAGASSSTPQVQQNIAIIFDIFSLEQMIGFILVISSFFGYGIVRNLASARVFECFYANTAIKMRELFINAFNISEHFDNLTILTSNDIHSSDYITIVICSFINFIMLAFGLFLVSGFENIMAVLVFYVVLAPLYFAFHFLTIEKYLKERVKKSNLTKGST